MLQKKTTAIIFFSLINVMSTLKSSQPQDLAIEREPQELAEFPELTPPMLENIRRYLKIHKTFPVVFTGYIKYAAYYDTRQVLGLRDDYVLFAPDRKILDPTGKDINAKGQGDMSDIESRLRATIKGPKVGNAALFGVIEADFLGFTASNLRNIYGATPEFLNIFRLRHAFMQLDWEKYSFIAGQTWHPVIVPFCWVETISFNGGIPFEPFSRSPQVRFTYQNERIRIIAAALSQVRFFNDGPEGFTAKYLRNAVVPNLHGQLQIKMGEHRLIASLDYKRLVPRIVTNKGFKVRESINSVLAFLLACLEWQDFYFRTKLTFAENGTNFGMFSGYAVHTIDPITDKRTYTNIREITFWIDTAIKIKNLEPGLFIGASKNLGSSKSIKLNVTDNAGMILERRVFGIGPDINTAFRIAPRLRWYVKKIVPAAELEYTRASYGTLTTKGKIIDTTPVGNLRFTFAVYYYF